VDRIKAALPQLRAALPPDVDLAVATDRTVTIRASVRDVERTVIMATILVVAVVAFFLRTRGAVLIPSLAVAVSLSGAVAVMLALGFSLDNLSLMALTVSTGFVVDDAIVVVENITRHVEAGMSRMEAALLGAREVGFTVLSITVSLIAVFVPILFMGGIMGRIFREFAMTLSAAILVSLLVSLTTTPMLCALLLRCQHKESRFGRFADGVFARLQGLYARALDWALEWRAVVLVSVLFTVALNIYLFVIVPKGLFPQQDTGQIAGGLQTDQSSSFQITRQRLQRLVDILTREPTMDTAVAFVGGRGPGGFLFASLKPKNVRHESAQSIIGRLRPKLSRVSGAALFLNPVQDLNTGGRSSNSTYQYTLRAESLSDLRLWTNKLTEALKTDPALVDVVNDQQDRGLQADVHIDYDTASRLKLTNRAIDNALYDSFGQRQVTTLYRDTNQYHVVMEIDPALAQDPTILNHVFISTGQPAAGAASASGKAQLIGAGVNVSHAQAGTPGAGSFQTSSVAVGGQAVTGPSAPPTRAASQGVAVSSQAEAIVPLPSVATWREKAAPAEVNHDNGSPSATISYNLAPGRSLGEAAKAIEAAKARIRMPATITGGSQGTAKLFQQSLSSEPMLIAAGLAAIYLVLGILYESYIHPLTVLSTLPSAGVGAVMALILFRMEFSLIALIGVILLIGIVKKNAILMIDFALVAERERGLDPVTAIREAALTRFRPIMMTTFAAILGAIPLALGFGEGAELRQPLGVTVIGGLLVSQALTLLTTPVVYLALDRFRRHRPSPQAAHA
jgi:multidrug efflux pump